MNIKRILRLIFFLGIVILGYKYYQSTYNSDKNLTVNDPILYKKGKGVKDINGQNYKSITINKQEWMSENLNVDRFRNGDIIPEVRSNEEWFDAGLNKQPAWCYYDNNSSNGKKYGKLYNWFAVNDQRGIAPKGWHVPKATEWEKLFDFLGGYNSNEDKLKSNNINWEIHDKYCERCVDSNTYSRRKFSCPNDKSGFSGLPCGIRTKDGFYDYNVIGYWWSSSDYLVSLEWHRYLFYNGGARCSYFINKELGLSVRLIKD